MKAKRTEHIIVGDTQRLHMSIYDMRDFAWLYWVNPDQRAIKGIAGLVGVDFSHILTGIRYNLMGVVGADSYKSKRHIS